MNTITDWINAEIIHALGWTIIHSLWQGAAIVAMVSLFLYLGRRRAANFRYWLSLSAFGTLFAVALGTFTYYYQPGESEAVSAAFLTASSGTPDLAAEETLWLETYTGTEAEATSRNHPYVFWKSLEPQLPLVVTLWLLGVFLFSLRMLAEVAYIQRLRWRSYGFESPHWQRLLALMAKNLHIRRRVALRESALVRTPMVLGYLKPMILFPVGLVNGLSGEQVESILAHELAHIKRHDYLINLLTSIIEILMFFNPAIWWLTSRIKAEREHCCDDLAIDLTGDAVTFVKTLAHLEDWRTQHQQLGLAMTGKNGSVLGRIQRLLHQTPKHPAPLKALLSVLCVAMVVGLFAFQTPAITPPVEASAEQIEPTEDVEEIREEAPTGEDQQAATEIREVAKPNYEQETPAATPQRDTVPQDIRKLEEDMRKIEAEMREKEIAMEKQEQLLRKQMLEKEKALQVRSYEMQKKMMELQMKEQALENSMQLRQHELEMNHSELREKELELEQQAAELERKAEALEQGEENTSIEELRKVNAELQTRKSEFLKKQRDLEKQMMSKEKEVRLQTLELRKQAQEMEEARYLLESELEGISREEQYQMQEIQQKMEALSTEQMLLHRELEKKHRELEARHEQLQEKMEQHEEDGFDGAH